MSLDIGFKLYEKKPFDEKGELVAVDFKPASEKETDWVCGRTDATNSWGSLFSFKEGEGTVPVFQKPLDGKEDECGNKCKFADFADFKDTVSAAIKSDRDEVRELHRSYFKEIAARKDEIAELRELQKGCSAENEYAFDRWTDKIKELKSEIRSYEEEIKSLYDDDYTWLHAESVENLLNTMESLIEKDEYYVVPYFSF